MRVALKLFASLADYLPPEGNGNRAELDVDDGTTVADLIRRYRVPERSAHLVLVNGVYIPPGGRETHRLCEGDELAVWPPIAGG